MKSITETIAVAADCRRAAEKQPKKDQQAFYLDLERYFLGLAEIKQWLHDTQKPAGIGSRPHQY